MAVTGVESTSPPPHPDRVVPLWKLRYQELTVVVGHHDLAELGVGVIGLGDNPNAGLGTLATSHDASDGLGVDLLTAHHDPRRAQDHENPDRRQFNSSSHHVANFISAIECNVYLKTRGEVAERLKAAVC